MLRTGELCVCQIGEVLELAPSTVSAHLRELRQAGLTSESKRGRWVHVGLSEDPGVQPWIHSTLGMLDGDSQVAADGHLVQALREVPVEDLCRLGFKAAKAKRDRRSRAGGRKATRPHAPGAGKHVRRKRLR